MKDGKASLNVEFETDNDFNEKDKETKESFLSMVNRGGLVYPSVFDHHVCMMRSLLLRKMYSLSVLRKEPMYQNECSIVAVLRK